MTTTMRSWTRRISRSGRRSFARRRSATSTRSSSTSRRCGSAARARSPRPGTGCRSSTSRTPRRSAGPATRSGRRAARSELDFELEVGAIVDTPAFNLPEERAGRGDRRLPDRQRLVRARPPAGRIDRSPRARQGQGLRDVDRSVDRHARRARRRVARRRARAGPRDDRDGRGRRRPDGRGLARLVVERALLVRADARPRVGRRPRPARRAPRERTVGTGCLLEVKDFDARAVARARRPGHALDRGDRRAPVARRRSTGSGSRPRRGSPSASASR